MFVKKASAISPQFTLDNRYFQGEIREFEGNHYTIEEPDYSDLIPRGMLRRMGKASRMGIKVGLPLIAERNDIDGILLGTADGGIEDSLKFVDQIIQYEEGTLTPTHFVQSTPNSVAGALALMTKNTCYNTTYIDKGLAFENCLLDAQLMFEEDQASNVLVGNVEQFSIQNYNIESQDGLYKDNPVHSSQLFNSGTKGTVNGEGSAMFILSNEKSEEDIEIIDLRTWVGEDHLEENLSEFLNETGCSFNDIDTVLLGMNGDVEQDKIYQNFSTHFEGSNLRTYKNLCGEYPTSTAFAMFLVVNLLSGKELPNSLYRLRNENEPQTVLIYNHYRALSHSLILLRK